MPITPSARKPLVTLSDAALSFDGERQVLRQLNLEVAEGEFLSIVGPSGSGKSTVLRLIAGLLEPTGGSVSRHRERTSLHFGFVFQQPTLLPWRTAIQNLLLPAELGAEKKDVSIYDAQQMLRRVGLSESDTQKRPSALSGGMQMRLSLARALILRPDVLLLDEPLAAVDDLLRMSLQEEVRRLHEELSLTSVLVTHNLAEAVFMSDRVVVLSGSPARVTHDVPVKFKELRSSELRSSDEFHRQVDGLTRRLLGTATSIL
ncbi:MAG: ABC transporter ATP-binding protein [Planctomycetaceae bacterium]|nr:ABC transporter ATP-binding protein [Planctomycetaceae bacterium]